MERTHELSKNDFDSSRNLGITLACFDIGEGRTQYHCGLIVTEQQSKTMHIHLASHMKLKCDDCSDKGKLKHYFWIDPAFTSRKLLFVSRMALLISKEHPRGNVPYGFSRPINVIDKSSGSISLENTQAGLTCASFVIAVFDAIGIQLVDIDTFIENEHQNTEWQQLIIEQFESDSRIPKEHIDLMKSEIGNIRITPDQVAASSIQSTKPTPLTALIPLATSLRCHIESMKTS